MIRFATGVAVLFPALVSPIGDFCEHGGTVIADFACGLFDQHGKGRARGALDDLFGVRHDGSETKKDFFAGKLWVEADQDAGFGGGITKLIGTLAPKLQDGFAIAETRLPVRSVKRIGAGTAVYLNLSPQRYLSYREENRTEDAHLWVFMKPVFDAGVRPWVKITADGKRPVRSEVTYLAKDGRTYVFIVQNAAVTSTSLGDTKTKGLGSGAVPIEVEFAAPVRDVVDERAGRQLGDGAKFTAEFNLAQAVLLSFAGMPPRR
jgi:hypothetical protein